MITDDGEVWHGVITSGTLLIKVFPDGFSLRIFNLSPLLPRSILGFWHESPQVLFHRPCPPLAFALSVSCSPFLQTSPAVTSYPSSTVDLPTRAISIFPSDPVRVLIPRLRSDLVLNVVHCVITVYNLSSGMQNDTPPNERRRSGRRRVRNYNIQEVLTVAEVRERRERALLEAGEFPGFVVTTGLLPRLQLESGLGHVDVNSQDEYLARIDADDEDYDNHEDEDGEVHEDRDEDSVASETPREVIARMSVSALFASMRRSDQVDSTEGERDHDYLSWKARHDSNFQQVKFPTSLTCGMQTLPQIQ